MHDAGGGDIWIVAAEAVGLGADPGGDAYACLGYLFVFEKTHQGPYLVQGLFALLFFCIWCGLRFGEGYDEFLVLMLMCCTKRDVHEARKDAGDL